MNFRRLRRLSAALTIAILSLAPATLAAQGYVIQTIAVTGEPAPGTDDGTGQGVPFQVFPSSCCSGPIIDGAGNVGFSAELQDSPPIGEVPDNGFWFGQPGAVSLVIRKGDFVDDANTVAMQFIQGTQILNTASQLALLVSTDATKPADVDSFFFSADAILAGMPNALELVAMSGTEPQGGPVGSILLDAGIWGLTLNNIGQIAYAGAIENPDNSLRIKTWATTLGALSSPHTELVSEPVTVFDVFGIEQYLLDGLNVHGDVVHFGTLTGEDGVARRGVWVDTPSPEPKRHLIAELFAPANGFPDVSFNLLSDAWTPNDAGEVVFAARVTSADPNVPSGWGFWHSPQPTAPLQIIAHQGTVAPDTGGQNFAFIDFLSPVLNGDGTVAFGAATDGGIEGLWVGEAVAPRLKVSSGIPAPGTDSDFQNFGITSPTLCGSGRSVDLNTRGDIAFCARLVDTDGNLLNDNGIWAGNPDSPRLVIRAGDTITVQPGDVRTVASLNLQQSDGTEEGGRHIFNDQGQIAFIATFADGSKAILRATPNAPPVAAADSLTVDEGGTQTELDDAATSVLANDTDAENHPLTAIVESPPSNGVLTLNPDGSFSYTHDGSETTSDSFGYFANDGFDDSDPVTVSIAINPANDPPVADAGPDQEVVFKKAQTTEVPLAGSGTDAENDPIVSYIWTLEGSVIAMGATTTVTLGEGIHVISLVVNDGATNSTPDTVTITVIKERGLAACDNPNSNKPECQS